MVRFPAGVKDIFVLQILQTDIRANPVSYSVGRREFQQPTQHCQVKELMELELHSLI
jgi:hypothetical protein